MLVGKCQWGSFGHPEGMYPAKELKYGIHGGDVETSLMLHFQPDLVDMGAAKNFHSSAQNLEPDALLLLPRSADRAAVMAATLRVAVAEEGSSDGVWRVRAEGADTFPSIACRAPVLPLTRSAGRSWQADIGQGSRQWAARLRSSGLFSKALARQPRARSEPVG